MRLLCAVSLVLLFAACTKTKTLVGGGSHKVTFNVEVESNDGARPLKIECAKFEEFEAYMRDQSAAMMSGKKPSVEKPQLIQFATPGKPEHNLSAQLELPSTKMTCTIDGKFMNIKNGDQSSQVFIPKGDASVSVVYNMYSKKLLKSDASGTTIEVVKN